MRLNSKGSAGQMIRHHQVAVTDELSSRRARPGSKDRIRERTHEHKAINLQKCYEQGFKDGSEKGAGHHGYYSNIDKAKAYDEGYQAGVKNKTVENWRYGK